MSDLFAKVKDTPFRHLRVFTYKIVEVEKTVLLNSFSTAIGPKSCYKQSKLHFADWGFKMATRATSKWQDLCQAASTEKDSERLLELVSEIDSILVLEKKSRPISEGVPIAKASGQ